MLKKLNFNIFRKRSPEKMLADPPLKKRMRHFDWGGEYPPTNWEEAADLFLAIDNTVSKIYGEIRSDSVITEASKRINARAEEFLKEVEEVTSELTFRMQNLEKQFTQIAKALEPLMPTEEGVDPLEKRVEDLEIQVFGASRGPVLKPAPTHNQNQPTMR